MNVKAPISLRTIALGMLSFGILLWGLWFMLNYGSRSKASAGANSVNVLFSPAAPTVPLTADQTMTVTVNPATATNKISGVDFRISSTGNVQITDVSAPTGLATQIAKTVAAQSARIAYVSTMSSDQLPAVTQFTITYHSATAGTGTIAIDSTNSQVVGTVSTTVFDMPAVTPANITFSAGAPSPTPGGVSPTAGSASPTISPTATVTSAPTVTSQPVPSPTPVGPILNMRMRFQGITGLPVQTQAQAVQVKLVKGTTEVTGTVQVTPDASGVWTGSVSLPVTTGSGYTLFVKGPRHLQKKICVSTPTETAIGTYRCSTGAVSIANGTNTVDLSGIVLLAGDLPQQDGVVDSYDTSYIRQTLRSTNAADLNIADINRDGIIDTQDMSLVIQALSIKFDEQ